MIVLLIAAALLVPQLTGNRTNTYETGEDGEPLPGVSLSELNQGGTRIAVLTGSELLTAAQEVFPEATPVQYDTFADIFYAVDSGKVDAALGFDTNIPLVRSPTRGWPSSASRWTLRPTPVKSSEVASRPCPPDRPWRRGI